MSQQEHKHKEIVNFLLENYGTTFADDANIRLQDAPAPLFQLLVLSLLISARIASEKAVSAAASLFSSGLTTPQKMADATWQERVDAITWSGYKRYDESTATMLGETAEMVLDKYKGDLRELHKETGGDTGKLHKSLQQFKGVGTLGANIFLREVQVIWDDVYPFADDRVLDVAGELGLPTKVEQLCELCSRRDFGRLTSALIRVKLAGTEQRVLEEASA